MWCEACLLLLLALRVLHGYGHPIDKIVGRIGDHRVRLAYSAEDFDPVSEIAAQSDLAEFDVILAVHHAHLRPLGLEENGVSRKHKRYNLQRKMEVDLGISTGKE